jgi:hypothetical protein
MAPQAAASQQNKARGDQKTNRNRPNLVASERAPYSQKDKRSRDANIPPREHPLASPSLGYFGWVGRHNSIIFDV